MATVAGNSLVRVTDTVYAAHTPHVNWTLVTGDNAVLLIDAGFPGDRSAVLASLAELGYRPADATYLAWLDCRPLGMGDAPVEEFRRRGVELSDGNDFGPLGAGHVRLNTATSASILERIVRTMASS